MNPITDAITDPAGCAGRAGDLAELDRMVITCRACERLVAWREQVAAVSSRIG